MNILKKILGAALVASFATGLALTSASAHDPNNHRARGGIFPALLGPMGVAAAVGSTTSTWFCSHLCPHHAQHATHHHHHKHTSTNKSNMGKAVVACVMGSALGAISASIRKATALGNPPRWRSQAEHERIVASGIEKKYELTSDEASTALAACGFGSFFLHWPQGNI